MKKFLLFLFFILSFLGVKAQKQDTTIYPGCRLANDPPGFDGDGVIFDSCPHFKGNLNDFLKYLSNHLRYPKVARANGVQGKVIITMVVEKNGSLSHIRVARGVGYGCDEEAVRVMKSCPPWTPGIKNGKICRVVYSIPISFTLTN